MIEKSILKVLELFFLFRGGHIHKQKMIMIVIMISLCLHNIYGNMLFSPMNQMRFIIHLQKAPEIIDCEFYLTANMPM